jgi:rhamnosyltransferase subunit B
MRVLFATIGSLGDLHPCLGLARELKRRGHTVVVASPEAHRTRVLDLGLEFRSLRPNLDPADSALIRQCEDLKSGFEVLISKLILPHLADTYSDLLAAAGNCDFMLAGEMVYAAPLVAEKTGLRWGSIILSPCSFLSAHDPSLLAPMPQLIRLRGLGWRINRAVLDLFTRLARHWWEPVRQLRIREGLDPDCAPLTRDKFSPDLVLALFSSAFAERQPDWPESTVQPGFVFYDRSVGTNEFSELARFLEDGDPPIVFTLGSTAVSNPGNFYESSLEAALRLGRRAVLIGARDLQSDSERIFSIAYAPYSEVFPRASVIVHQGGSGTTGQALRAGRPMLFVPYGWDQPDNALRVERLGAGLSLARTRYSAETAMPMLERLLTETRFAGRAALLGEEIRLQRGVEDACDAVEKAMLLS